MRSLIGLLLAIPLAVGCGSNHPKLDGPNIEQADSDGIADDDDDDGTADEDGTALPTMAM
jgi:hypothetical protein